MSENNFEGLPTGKEKDSISSVKTIRIGTRASLLALWQANWCADRLRQAGISVEIVKITASGDNPATFSQPISACSSQGVFAKEIQEALLNGTVDLAVHSLKDLPTENAAGLQLTATPERAAVEDVLVPGRSEATRRKLAAEGKATLGSRASSTKSRSAVESVIAGGNSIGGEKNETVENGGWIPTSLAEIPDGMILGTSSLRRRAQLLAFAEKNSKRWEVRSIRGNLNTRLRKLDAGEYDALILARAGVERLELTERVSAVLPIEELFPAVGQGALGLETRADDTETIRIVREALNDDAVFQCVLAERIMLQALDGGCATPIGGLCRFDAENQVFTLRGRVIAVDGRVWIETELSGPDPRELGLATARELIARGAGELIREAREI